MFILLFAFVMLIYREYMKYHSKNGCFDTEITYEQVAERLHAIRRSNLRGQLRARMPLLVRPKRPPPLLRLSMQSRHHVQWLHRS